MDYKLTQGNNSNYEIKLTIDNEELESYKSKVLQGFQKDVELPGFRKGHAPLDLVEQKVQPQYIKMGMYEEGINEGLNKIMEENPNKQFIGNIYDLNQEEKDGQVILTFKLDVYPEAEVKDKKWQNVKIEEANPEVTNEEIENTIKNIQRQHAEYKDVEEMTAETVAKVKLNFLDKDGNSLDTGTAFVGKEDMDEFKTIKDSLVGVKLNETIELKYDTKKLPPHLQCKKEDAKPTKVEIQLVEIKEENLPELTEEKIQQLFNNEVKNYEELKEKVDETMKQQKWQNELVRVVEDYVKGVEEFLDVNVPATIVNEEVKSRLNSLKERFGGEEAFNKYQQQMTEEQQNQMNQEIEDAARDSLKKFFILRKATELWGVHDSINWQQQMDPEEKLYNKLKEENATKQATTNDATSESKSTSSKGKTTKSSTSKSTSSSSKKSTSTKSSGTKSTTKKSTNSKSSSSNNSEK